jgi:AmmeMemoRadiSam system protein A
VGQGREKEIAKTLDAFRRVSERIAADQPELIIFFTPHGLIYSDYIHIAPGNYASGNLSRFNAPNDVFSLEYDTGFIAKLSAVAEAENIPAGTLGGRGGAEIDHGVTVPLHFINQQAFHHFKAARISISGLPAETHYRFGQCVREAIEETGRRAVIVASGDLSHKLTQDGPYGYAPEGPTFDRKLIEALGLGDFLRLLTFEPSFCEKAAECGLRSFIMMAGALDGLEVEAKFHSYEGPFGVGYALCSFTPGGKKEDRNLLPKYEALRLEKISALRAKESPYVRLARKTLEEFVASGRIPPARFDGKDLPPEMLSDKAGTFVSIKKDGQLRGCIGTTEPYRKNIAEEIIGNAISAGTRDPRFDAVRAEELPYLTYSVDVLSPAEPVDGPGELDVKRYGVIVASKDGKRGLLLPNLDGVDTVSQQIAIAKQKAGITEGESCTLARFEVVRHG